jgi:hypothetical protein
MADSSLLRIELLPMKIVTDWQLQWVSFSRRAFSAKRRSMEANRLRRFE